MFAKQEIVFLCQHFVWLKQIMSFCNPLLLNKWLISRINYFQAEKNGTILFRFTRFKSPHLRSNFWCDKVTPPRVTGATWWFSEAQSLLRCPHAGGEDPESKRFCSRNQDSKPKQSDCSLLLAGWCDPAQPVIPRGFRDIMAVGTDLTACQCHLPESHRQSCTTKEAINLSRWNLWFIVCISPPVCSVVEGKK